jgi:Protein of unknown function (DUF3307)
LQQEVPSLSTEETAIIGVLVILQVKHYLFDFVFQRPYEFFRHKGDYGHPSGIIHAGLHAFGSTPAFLVITPTFWVGAAIVVGEFLIHYHVDWTKEQIERRLSLSAANKSLVLGADQLAHHLTYAAMIAVLIPFA